MLFLFNKRFEGKPFCGKNNFPILPIVGVKVILDTVLYHLNKSTGILFICQATSNKQLGLL